MTFTYPSHTTKGCVPLSSDVKDTGAYSLYGEDDVMYCFYDRDLAIWFDSTREEILKILSSICEEIGIHGLGFPRKRYEW